MTPQISDLPVPESFRFGYGDTTLGTILVDLQPRTDPDVDRRVVDIASCHHELPVPFGRHHILDRT